MMSSFAEKLSNIICEYRLGIATRGLANVDSSSDEQIHYATISYRAINVILNHLQLQPSDTFIDLGSGKGRVVCCAATRILNKVIGIECSPALAEVSRSNASRLRGRQSPIEIQNIQAQEFDYSLGTVIYMFHPFGRNTMLEVLSRLKRGLQEKPRQIHIAYVNPVHDSVLRRCLWLEEYDHWQAGVNTIGDHDVGWWRSLDHGY